MIPDDVVERVSDGADIVAIIGEHVKLKRIGTRYRGPCPFHQGTHDNFSVTPGGGYRCFVCGETGSVFTFLQKRLGLDFVDAVKYVGQKSGIEVREVSRQREGPDPREPLWEVNAAAADYFRRVLWDEPIGTQAREYLDTRGVTREDADRFTLGFAPREIGLMRAHLQTLGFDENRQLLAGLLKAGEDNQETRPRFRGRLMFPIHDVQGRVIAFGGRVIGQGEPKYLNSSESPAFVKGRTLYGLHWARNAIRKADRVILVEGYFDCVRLIMAGVDEVIAPLGTALTEPQAEMLRRYTKNVFLLYDSDAAGLKATFRAGDTLLRQGMSVQVVTLPEGEDPDSFVRAQGKAKLEEHITAAIDVLERKLQLLERGGWFSDLRRKRQAVDRLLPTLRAVSDRITRDLYVARVAEAAGVSREMLEREIGHAAEPEPGWQDDAPPAEEFDVSRLPYADYRLPSTGSRPSSRDSRASRGVTAERELVRVMWHRPATVELVAERIGPQEFRDKALGAIYTRLVELGAERAVETVAAGLDAAAVDLLEWLVAQDSGLDDPEGVVQRCLAKLQVERLQTEMDEIGRQLPLADGAEQDQLLVRKKQLADEWRSLGAQRYKRAEGTRS